MTATVAAQADTRPPDAGASKPRRTARRRAPTILQMEALECGAAALAMVLAYHGRWVPLEELRVACGISRDGSKASNLIKAAQRYGLVGRGFRREVEELAELPLPAIIHWNFNHFVVIEGFGRRGAYLNDPAEGRRTVSYAEFDEAFTGVVLTFEPAPEFAPGGRPPSLIRVLTDYLQHTRSALAFLGLVSVAMFVPGLAVPAFTRIFVDDVLVRQFHDWLPPLVIGMVIAALLRGALVLLQQLCLIRLEQRLSIGMGMRLVMQVMRLPPQFFGQRYAGEIANRIAASDRVAELFSRQFAANLLALTSLVFYAAVMAVFDLTLTAVGLLLGMLNFLALKAVSRSRDDLNRTLLVERGKVVGTTVDVIRSIESIKASALEQGAFTRCAGYQAKATAAEQQLAAYEGLLGVLPILLGALTTAAILGIGGFRVMDGSMTVGTLVAFQALMAGFTAPIGKLVEFAGSLQQIRADLERANDVLRHPCDPMFTTERAADLPPLARLTGSIELSDITFGFSPLDPPFIENFSLSLQPGTRVALVGVSGSGKSTLGRVICGLYQPWSGEVRYDGWPIQTIPRELFASSVAYVDQDIFLFEGTVRKNLTLWDTDVPDETLALAMKDAAVHTDVATRAGRYDCAVLEGGANFSGGQRQRLEIARALTGNPTVLVLDEATAALDPLTEQHIDDAVRRRGATAIIIAHRLSTIRDCDEIIVLDRGKVAGRGRHHELLATCALYAALVRTE
jgi:NHLM bacteriocin system ABC transporter peptidase/ATP-binding protein